MTITYPDVVEKTALRTLAVSAANKVTAGDVNEIVRALNEAIDQVNTYVGPSAEAGVRDIRVLADLPTPVGNVITLEDYATYRFVGDVDLQGNRLVCGTNNVLLGNSSENSTLTSTGLVAQPLITATTTMPMRFLAIKDVDIAVNMSDSGDGLDWMAVNFVNCGEVGTIANYSNFIMESCALLDCGPLRFDGSIGTIGFDGCLFVAKAGTTAIVVEDTAIVTRRFRMLNSSMVIAPGCTGIDFSALATVPDEAYILDLVNFSGGGTYQAGRDYTDASAHFDDVRGIVNTAILGNMYIAANALATTNPGIGQHAQVAASASALVAASQKFEHDAVNHALEYTGAYGRLCNIQLALTLTGPTNNTVGAYIAVAPGGVFTPATNDIEWSEVYTTASGTRPDSLTLFAAVYLEPGDKVYAIVENASGTGNITVTYMHLLIRAEV